MIRYEHSVRLVCRLALSVALVVYIPLHIKLLNVLYINQSALCVLHELAFSFDGCTHENVSCYVSSVVCQHTGGVHYLLSL